MNYLFSHITFLTQADNIRKRKNLRVHDVCKFLYEYLKKEIPNTHSFYVGLYNEYINQIGFPYTCDEDNWDVADYRPIGDGPTSRVIRTREPFILNDENLSQHQSGSHFGNKNKTSKSALHYPMFAMDTSNNSVLVGVISIQSYKANNYNEEMMLFFELIAKKAGELFLPFIEDETVKTLHEKLAKQTNVFNQFLYEITNEISKIIKLADKDASPEISSQLEIFSNYCKELQSTMTVGIYEIPSLKERVKLELLEKLTPIQRKIVEKLLEGKKNREISQELSENGTKISYDSVKQEITKICDTLDIEEGRGRSLKLYNLFHE